MSKKLLLLFAVLILLVGCQEKPASDHRVWYLNKDEAIHNGLIHEGVTKEDLLGIEEDQGDTLIFYRQDLKFVKGHLIESKPVNNASNLFYFLMRDTTADVTSIEVNTSE